MFEEGSFFDKYFNVNLSDYPAFGFDFNVSLVLFALFLGLCVAIIIITLKKCAATAVLRQLLRHEATGEGAAKVLSEIGLSESRSAKRALSCDKMLRRYIKLVGEVKISYEDYMKMSKEEQKAHDRGRAIDFSDAKFFIPEEEADRAVSAVQSDTSSPLTAFLLCAVMLAAFFLLSMALPTILSFAASAIG